MGPAIIWQYAIDEGPVQVHHVWRKPVRETLRLLEMFCDSEICAFNLPFDWYHANKDYNVLRFMDPDQLPSLEHWKRLEVRASREALCLKPRGALDLYLHALHGPMQTLLSRKDIRLRRVPFQLAEPLLNELNARVKLDDIYFLRRGGDRWKIDSSSDEEYPDLVLGFGASAALKPLIHHLFGVEVEDLPVPDFLLPNDNADKKGWYPWHNMWEWPQKLRGLIDFWYNTDSKYATDDVEYVRRLWHHWGKPPATDDDSSLACMVAAARWRGFAINRDAIPPMREEQIILRDAAPRAPRAVLSALHGCMSDVERGVVTNTKDETLKQILRWESHPAAELVKKVIAARTAEKRANLLLKLWSVGSFHPDYKILGTKSARMAGKGGLNAQGIDNWLPMRQLFTLAFPGEYLSGGDFATFEPSIAAAVYKDPFLEAVIKSGKKIHGLMGEQAFDMDYPILIAKKEAGGVYDRAKKGMLAWMYGAQAERLSGTLDVDMERAEAVVKWVSQRFPMMAKHREKTVDKFCAMKQPGGIGTRVVWHTPPDYIESFLGDRRYYQLENAICWTLFDLAQDLPEHMKMTFKVKRRDRIQSAAGAVCSALYAAAFQIQAANMRSAVNHEIQSPGARMNKRVQRHIWDLQPAGIHPFCSRSMNSHDELSVVSTCPDAVEDRVNEGVEMFRDKVPLLAMDWKKDMATWGDMK